MLTKEILNDISLDELKAIAKEWRRIQDICDGSEDGYKQFEVTQEDSDYVDRDIYMPTYSMRITTYKESGATIFSTDIILFNEDYEIAETCITEIENFIYEMEAT